MGGLPACAVSGNDDVRMDCLYVLDCLWDYLFEDSTGQVHSTDEAVDLLYRCYSLGVGDYVGGARLAAAGRHDESFLVDVENNALIILRPGIRLPALVAVP